MSDTKCAYIGCKRPSHRFWRLCDEHGPEYGDVVRRLVRASTPHLTTDTTNRGYDLKRAIEVAPQAWRAAWAVSGSALDAEERSLYFDAHVDARQYALGFDPAGDSVTVVRMPSPPKPPTLREWLGDRVGELGRWADVLREQPVPAGYIVSWNWRGDRLVANNSISLHPMFITSLWDDDMDFTPGQREAFLMAIFTRHPDVKLEPKPAAFPWDPYPEVA